MLDDAMMRKGDKNLVDLKNEINTILTEKHRIKKLFTLYSSLSNIDKDYFYYLYKNILTGIDLFDEIEESQDESQEKKKKEKQQATHDQLYRLRNILYHNLRAFKNTEVVDQNLKNLNLEFEKIIVSLLTTFKINGNET